MFPEFEARGKHLVIYQVRNIFQCFTKNPATITLSHRLSKTTTQLFKRGLEPLNLQQLRQIFVTSSW